MRKQKNIYVAHALLTEAAKEGFEGSAWSKHNLVALNVSEA